MFSNHDREEIALGFAVVLKRSLHQQAVSQLTDDMKRLRERLAYLEELDAADLEWLKVLNGNGECLRSKEQAKNIRRVRERNARERAHLAIALKAHKQLRAEESRCVDRCTGAYVHHYEGDDDDVFNVACVSDAAIVLDPTSSRDLNV